MISKIILPLSLLLSIGFGSKSQIHPCISSDDPFDPDSEDELFLKIALSSIIFVDGLFSSTMDESIDSFLLFDSIFGFSSTATGDSRSDTGSNSSTSTRSDDSKSFVVLFSSSTFSIIVSLSSMISSVSFSVISSSISVSLSFSAILFESEISVFSIPNSIPYSSGGG